MNRKERLLPLIVRAVLIWERPRVDFTYIEDPDGTLIEFVETHKVPIAKKFGLFVDMIKRDPENPFQVDASGVIKSCEAFILNITIRVIPH